MKLTSQSHTKALSLHPLPLEKALRLFMQVRPEKIEAEIKKLKADKNKAKKKY
jgi:hypothetical protein